MNFSVIQGGIAAQRADVIVNAAGTSLRMGSGVAGALRRGANGPTNEEAVSKGPVDLGELVVCETVNEYDLESLTDVRVIAYSAPEYKTVREITTDVQSE